MSSTRSARTTRFLAAATLGAAGLGALGLSAATATADFTFRQGNPSCADVAPAGVTWTEHKIDQDPAHDSTHFADSLDVRITKAGDGSLSWTSALDVDAVIMKGGDNANVYAYPDDDASGAEDKADSGLRTPVNENGNPDNGTKYYGISHVTFCSGPPATPPAQETPSTPGVTETPAPAPAATPTPAPEVSATAAPAPAAPAAVVPEAVETAVLGVSIEAPAAPAPAPAPAPAAAQLAATGVSSATLAALAIALIVFGGVALALGGRPTTDD